MATFTVNGQTVQAEKNQKLIRFLRDELRLTSVKDGCSEGACGTCTVLIDGKPTKACIPQTDKLEGKSIVTVEGLTDFEKQVYTYAFGMAGAVQCGFCIPGMVIMTPSDENELRKMLTTGHLYNGPAAVRYPRGNGPNAVIEKDLAPIEIGKGITFRPKNDWFELTMRFRMQNMVGLSFDKDFTLTKTDAQVKRLRLRFDGHIYSPKLVYSIQLGFTSYDTEPLPNGNMNIVRDAIVYYVPSPKWNIGFGQTKIKANRARTNSSSALQFIDRSIVNSEFNLDRGFGFFERHRDDHAFTRGQTVGLLGG